MEKCPKGGHCSMLSPKWAQDIKFSKLLDVSFGFNIRTKDVDEFLTYDIKKISNLINENIITNFGNYEYTKVFILGCYISSNKQKKSPYVKSLYCFD